MSAVDLVEGMAESATLLGLVLLVRRILRRWSHRPAVLAPYLGVAAFFAFYTVVHEATLRSLPAALGNAHWVHDIEGPAGQWIEATSRSIIAWQPAWGAALLFYATAHILVTTIAAGAVVINGRPAEMLPLGLVSAAAIVVFLAFPVAPPNVYYHHVTAVPGPEAVFAAPYAAFPSLHCAWALWASQTLRRRVRQRAGRARPGRLPRRRRLRGARHPEPLGSGCRRGAGHGGRRPRLRTQVASDRQSGEQQRGRDPRGDGRGPPLHAAPRRAGPGGHPAIPGRPPPPPPS